MANSTSDRSTYMKQYRLEKRQAGSRRISVTVSAAEFEALSRHASKHGQKVTGHLKRLAMAYLNNQYVVPPDIEYRIDDMVAIMRGIGNNLNQMARHSNEMRYFLDTEEVRLNVRLLEDTVRAFLEKPDKQGASS